MCVFVGWEVFLALVWGRCENSLLPTCLLCMQTEMQGDQTGGSDGVEVYKRGGYEKIDSIAKNFKSFTQYQSNQLRLQTNKT